jgi:hypothetical protein
MEITDNTIEATRSIGSAKVGDPPLSRIRITDASYIDADPKKDMSCIQNCRSPITPRSPGGIIRAITTPVISVMMKNPTEDENV